VHVVKCAIVQVVQLKFLISFSGSLLGASKFKPRLRYNWFQIYLSRSWTPDYHNLFSYEPENWDKKSPFYFTTTKQKIARLAKEPKHKALQHKSQQTQINPRRSNLHMATRKINDKHQTVQPAKFCRYRLVILQPLFVTL